MKYYLLLLIPIILFLVINCSTVVKTYKNDSSDKNYSVKIEIRKDKNGKEITVLSSKVIEPIFFSGNLKTDSSGDMEFDISSINFFTNWEGGWTEGEGSVNAKLIFYKENDRYRCKVLENYEFFEITKGSLRFQDQYYYDEKGLNSVKHKFDRIVAVNDFLKTREDAPDFFRNSTFLNDGANSHKLKTKEILFPEFFPNSIIYKSKEYEPKDPSSDLSIAETIVWNKIYTKKIMPENLRPIRDSGSMYRDFEETANLLFAEYNLKYFFEKFLVEQKFF